MCPFFRLKRFRCILYRLSDLILSRFKKYLFARVNFAVWRVYAHFLRLCYGLVRSSDATFALFCLACFCSKTILFSLIDLVICVIIEFLFFS